MIQNLSTRGTSASKKRMAGMSAIVAIAALGLSLVAATPANATNPAGTVMVQTQRMSAATLQSTQNGWYAKGSNLSLSCYARGQAVKGYYSPYIPGGYDNLWYKVSDGYWVADVDINTGSNNPVTPACNDASIDTNTWYTLTARNSGKLVNIRGGGTSNGTAVQQYAADKTKSENFRFIPTDNGYYRVLSQLSTTQVWDVTGVATGNGAKVQTYNWVGANNQQWQAVSSGDGYLSFKPRHATSRCLDVPGASKADSVQLQIYSCNNTAAQQFKLSSVGTVTVPQPPASSIAAKVDSFVGKYNGKYVDVDGYPKEQPYQCTDLFNRFHMDVMGGTYVRMDGNGGAKNLWSTTNSEMLSKYVKVSASEIARKGDVAVWSGSKPGSQGFGHVSIVLRDLGGGTIETFTQNPGASRVANDSKSYLLGYFRPKA